MWAKAFKTFYRLHDLATSWAQARQICEAEGTSLLVPSSLEEMDNLKLLISNMKAHFTAIFIGIHDQFAHGEYVTIQGISNFYCINAKIAALIYIISKLGHSFFRNLHQIRVSVDIFETHL